MEKRFVNAVKTPAFIIDERELLKSLQCIKKIKKVPVSVLYTLKPLSNPYVLKSMLPYVDGFSASSLFEAKLAKSIIGKRESIHITTPGFRPNEIATLDSLCGYIAFNSIPQLLRLKKFIRKAKIGLRINPELSFVNDERYDPVRKNSKLGVPLKLFDLEILKQISGLHFHTHCNATSFEPLLKTVQKIIKYFGDRLFELEWINLGGGYLYSQIQNYAPFYKAVELLNGYNLSVFVEPGGTFVRSAGSIVSSVIDVFPTNHLPVAVLDTTVNHMPEVYEYQFSPSIEHQQKKGKFVYVLAGSSCLAGDIFGKYYFNKSLTLGSKIIFNNRGDYSHVKSHMFNGINLPNQYFISKEGKLELKRQFNYQDFISQYYGNLRN